MDRKHSHSQKRKHDFQQPDRPKKAAKLSNTKVEPTKKYASELDRILDQGRELVFNSIKLVRRFERQKLSRRSKTAEVEKNEKDIKRIEDEIKALNTLEVGQVTERHIKKILMKVKAISSSGRLPESITTKEFLALDQATANITARLYKAPQVTAAMEVLIEAVRKEVAPKPEESVVVVTKKTKTKSDESAAKAQANAQNHEVKSISPDGFTAETTIMNAGTGASGLCPNRGQIESSLDQQQMDQDSEDAENESHSISNSDEQEQKTEESSQLNPNNGAQQKEVSVSLSPSPSPDFSEDEPHEPISRMSMFLPSLTAGGYISDSDSSASDINDEIAPRKNRRGQRARQAIAERKYGSGAKHLQREKTKNGGRDSGWDARRGAVGNDEGGGKVHADRARLIREPYQADVVEKKKEERKKDDSGPLHPSWIARKQAKEKEKGGLNKFAGKKVVFD